MKVKVSRIYIGKEVNDKTIKVKYDKTSRKRPAWIFVEGLPKNVVHLGIRIDGNRYFYRIYLSPNTPLFLPANYTKDEMRKFYDKLSEIYDVKEKSKNISAAKFLLKKVKLRKDAKILDLGAGTGLAATPFVKVGYKNITLLDYSTGMLEKAKKRRELIGCRFVHKDIREFEVKEKFNLVLSIFSFASNSYFNEEEMPKLWRKLAKNLKQNGIIALLGYDHEPPRTLFEEMESGKRRIVEDYFAKWYIGKKK